MAGIRKRETIVCPSCGANGEVGLGMAMIGARNDYREFACSICNGAVPYSAPRAILDITWSPITNSKTSERPSLG